MRWLTWTEQERGGEKLFVGRFFFLFLSLFTCVLCVSYIFFGYFFLFLFYFGFFFGLGSFNFFFSSSYFVSIQQKLD